MRTAIKGTQNNDVCHQQAAVQHTTSRKCRIRFPVRLTAVTVTPQAFNRNENEKQRRQHQHERQRKYLLHLHIIANTGHSHKQNCAHAACQRINMIALAFSHLLKLIPGCGSKEGNSGVENQAALSDNGNRCRDTDYTSNNTC